MLKTVRSKTIRARGSEFAIVASQYNSRYVDSMVSAARAELRRAGVRRVQIFRVPGAFEIPLVAARLARTAAWRASSQEMPAGAPCLAIICLGVILRGATTHAEHIGNAVSDALMQIQLRYEVPVIHEVLLLENEEQARQRCLGQKHNRGKEAAQTALQMAGILANLHL
jgi:6,7-dimethyl-8-ribityllumazine synthase